MPLFTRNMQHGVQSFIIKLLNNNCAELAALADGPRADSRGNLTVVVLVIPVEDKKPAIDGMFAAVTREFSANGVSLVLDEPKPLDKVIVGFRGEGEMVFVRGEAKHLNPMGAGFYSLGLELTEILCTPEHPELQGVRF